MLLSSIGIFRITFGNIYTFIFGIAVGLAIATILYLLYILRQMNSKKFKDMSSIQIVETKIDPKSMTKEEKQKILNDRKSDDKRKQVCALILEYEELFKDKKLRKGYSDIEYTKYLTWSLIQNIAAIYHPKDKRPYLSITIKDATKLIRYASKRMDEILDINGLRVLRKININSANGMLNFYKRLYDHKIVKLIYKFKLNKILFGFKVLINIINPIYWVRKFIINRSFSIVTKKICVNVIQISGEEAYNIYSKNAFNEGDDLIEAK